MTFKPEEIDNFLEVFNESKEQIRGFEGCQHLELLEDYHESNVLLTHSHWTDDVALDNYRNSELFANVWAKTKPLFAERPLAFSSKKRITLA